MLRRSKFIFLVLLIIFGVGVDFYVNQNHPHGLTPLLLILLCKAPFNISRSAA